jgi:RNA polymerase sigma factor (sigma-70 family)
MTFGELLSDPGAEEDFDRAMARVDREQVPELLARLGERDRTIVCARFGLGCPERTLRELAGDLGVSAERVRQLERRALDSMRDALEPQAASVVAG